MNSNFSATEQRNATGISLLKGVGRFACMSIFAAATLVPVHGNAKVLFDGDFEVSSIWDYTWKASGNAPTLSKGEIAACDGKGVMKVSLDRDNDATSYRTEMTRLLEIGDNGQFDVGKPYWVSVAMYVPKDWKPDQPERGEILFQFHRGPDEVSELRRNPPFTFRIMEDEWSTQILGDTRYTMYEKDYQESERYSMGKVVPGKWTTFLFYVQFDQRNGFVKAWKDGDQQFSHKGVVGFNDLDGPYLKVGLYKPSWRRDEGGISKRVYYMDELRVSDGNSSFEDSLISCSGSGGSGSGDASTGSGSGGDSNVTYPPAPPAGISVEMLD